jgi:hypothetical protein
VARGRYGFPFEGLELDDGSTRRRRRRAAWNPDRITRHLDDTLQPSAADYTHAPERGALVGQEGMEILDKDETRRQLNANSVPKHGSKTSTWPRGDREMRSRDSRGAGPPLRKTLANLDRRN